MSELSVVTGRVITVDRDAGQPVADAGVVYVRPVRPFDGSAVVSDAPLTWRFDGDGYVVGAGGERWVAVPPGQYRLDFAVTAGWVRSQVVNVPHGGTVEEPWELSRLLGVEGNSPQPWVLTVGDVLRILAAGDQLSVAEETAESLLRRLAEAGQAVENVESAVVEAAASASTAEARAGDASGSAADAADSAVEAADSAARAEAARTGAEAAEQSAVSIVGGADDAREAAEVAAGAASSSATAAGEARDGAAAHESRVEALAEEASGSAVDATAAAEAAAGSATAAGASASAAAGDAGDASASATAAHGHAQTAEGAASDAEAAAGRAESAEEAARRAADDADGSATAAAAEHSALTAAIAAGDYRGVGIEAVENEPGGDTATVRYTDGNTSALPLPPGPPPLAEWDGAHLVVGGQRSPDLTGPPSFVPGPPGAVPTAQDYLVAGPGRPDAPTTTGMSSAALDALPVGAEYRSTDGAGTGAWVWRKRPSGWVVIDGDTGWVDVAGWIRGGSGGGDPVQPTSGTLHIRRVNNWITWNPQRFIVPKDDAPAILIPDGFAGTGMVLAANWDQTGLRTFNYERMTGGNYRVRPASGVQSPWGGQITSIAPATAAEPWPTALSPTL